MYCVVCGTKLESDAHFCQSCGSAVLKTSAIETATTVENHFIHFNELDNDINSYHQKQFSKFDSNGGSFQPTWNWVAFFFAIIWYFVKGMWCKGLIFLIIGIVVTTLDLEFGFLFAFYAGLAGNYDYYLLKRKKTQWW